MWIRWIRIRIRTTGCFIYIWSMNRTYGKDYVWEEEVVPRPSKPTRGGRPSSVAETPQEARPQASSSVKPRAGGQKKRKASGQLEETDTKVRVGWKRLCF
jgi:hypothetical protein